MITSLNECSSSDYEDYLQGVNSAIPVEKPQPISAEENEARLYDLWGQVRSLEMDRRVYKELRYAEMIDLMTEIPVCFERKRAERLEANPDVRQYYGEMASWKELCDYFIPTRNALLLIADNRPIEAIDLCSKVIERLNSGELSEYNVFGVIYSEKDLTHYASQTCYLRGLAYLMAGETTKGIADLKTYATVLESGDYLWDRIIRIRLLEQQLGVPLLENQIVSRLKYVKMCDQAKIDYCLQNGKPEKALELMATCKEDSLTLIRQAIAHKLLGNTNETARYAANYLENAELPNNFLRFAELAHLFMGDFSTSRSNVKGWSDDGAYGQALTKMEWWFPWLPLISYFESCEIPGISQIINRV